MINTSDKLIISVDDSALDGLGKAEVEQWAGPYGDICLNLVGRNGRGGMISVTLENLEAIEDLIEAAVHTIKQRRNNS